jgi:uncharacterized membrane protein
MKRRWIGAALIGAMVLFTLLIWNQLPDRIPTHWNFRGQVDNWSARFPGAWLIPGIATAIWLLLPLLRNVDPRRQHYESFAETFHTIINVIVGYMTVIHVLVLGAAMGWDIDVSRTFVALIGVTFIAIGNFLPRIRSNWWLGIRTPWTLDSERIWRETHRLAGWTFVSGGLVAAFAMLILPLSLRFAVAFVGLMASALIPAIWSYVLWRKQ